MGNEIKVTKINPPVLTGFARKVLYMPSDGMTNVAGLCQNEYIYIYQDVNKWISRYGTTINETGCATTADPRKNEVLGKMRGRMDVPRTNLNTNKMIFFTFFETKF